MFIQFIHIFMFFIPILVSSWFVQYYHSFNVVNWLRLGLWYGSIGYCVFWIICWLLYVFFIGRLYFSVSIFPGLYSSICIFWIVDCWPDLFWILGQYSSLCIFWIAGWVKVWWWIFSIFVVQQVQFEKVEIVIFVM